MIFRIPTGGKFAQTNRGEVFGNLYRTLNMDFKTSPGKLKIAPRLIINTKDNDGGITGLGVPCAFSTHAVSGSQQYYAACGIGTGLNTGTGKILVSASALPTSVFSNDALSNTPTDVHAEYSDMVKWTTGVYGGGGIGPSLMVSTYDGFNSQIKRLQGTWDKNWFGTTVSGTFTSSAGVKNMCVGSNGNLYITDDYKIIYVPYTTTGSALPAILSGAGTINTNGAYRTLWIRATSSYLWIGLMSYNSDIGSKGFVAKWDGSSTAFNNIYDINSPCPLSCVIKDDVPYVIDAYGRLKKYNGTGFEEIARLPVANQNIEMPGIYNDSTNARWIHHRGMDIVDGKINILVNNFVSTGVYVEDMPSGVWEFDEAIGIYHKSSPATASTDWGQQLLLSVGALFGSKRSVATFLAGLAYYTDSGTTSRTAIFYDDIATKTNKRGLFITPWLNSNAINDIYHKVWYTYRHLLSNSKIITRYRTDKGDHLQVPFIASATWLTTSRLSSTDSNFQYIVVGDEIEIVQGPGASTSAHVTNIVLVAGNYVMDLTDTIGPSSGSCKVRATNYQLAGVIDMTGIGSQFTSVNKVDNMLMVKTEIRDEGEFEMDDIIITSVTQQTAQ